MLQLFEFVLFAMFSYVMFSQVIIPLWAGRPFFPWLRKPGHVEARLAEVREDVEVVNLENEVDRIVAELKQLRNAKGDTDAR